MIKHIFVLCSLGLMCTVGFSQTKLVVQADKPVADIQPTMGGIFF